MAECKSYSKARAHLATWLRDHAKSTKDLANHLGVSVQAVNQFKQGTAFPKTENLIKIAELYGISLDYLMGYTDVPNRGTSIPVVPTGGRTESIRRADENVEEVISISIKAKTITGEVHEGQLKELKRVNDFYEEEGLYNVTLITLGGAEILLRGVSGGYIEFGEQSYRVV